MHKNIHDYGLDNSYQHFKKYNQLEQLILQEYESKYKI